MHSVLRKGLPHALMWFAYALANLGLLWYEIEKWDDRFIGLAKLVGSWSKTRQLKWVL